ncbi:type II secretion system F family protein [Candidatus Micrarchaeota archaeon]|jgi:Flp pilus assembly protein TadB|nr:type II secretion system F family protein [Candidatus Micrarchaeota archaeon]
MKFRKMLSLLDQKPSEWLVKTLFFSVFTSIILSISTFILTDDLLFSFIVLISSNILVLVFSVWYVYYKKNKLMSEIDNVLPEYLENVSGYIKAGFSPILALKSGLRPEFGLLSRTLEFATTKSLGPTPADNEILSATSELESIKLQRILTLFLTSYISGGQVGTMLERMAKDLRESNDIRKKLITGVSVYIIFISLALILILPLIVSISIKFLEISSDGTADLSMITTLAVLMLTLTSLFTGMFVGVVKNGKELMGFKHSLTLALISNMMFFIYSIYLIPFVLGPTI